jgi:iron(III) transport system permease protein
MALLTAFLCMVVAIPASYIIVKTKAKLKLLIELLIMLPFAIPSSAIAINMINAFNKPTIFAGNNILVGSYILLPIAYFVSLLPLLFRTTNISLQHLNDTYIEASKSLKANHIQTFRKVILPMVTPGIIGGVMLIVIRSIGEYTISAFLYTVDNKPISIAMVNGIFEY